MRKSKVQSEEKVIKKNENKLKTDDDNKILPKTKKTKTTEKIKTEIDPVDKIIKKQKKVSKTKRVVSEKTVILDQEINLDNTLNDAGEVLEIQDDFFVKTQEKNVNLNHPEIIFSEVELKYNEEIILKDINVEIFPKEFVFIVGPSGAGKSSIMKMIYKEKVPTAGRLIVDGLDLLKLKNSKVPYLRRKIGVIFQDYQLLPNKNVFENIAFALEATGYPKKNIQSRVNEMLNLVNLEDKKNRFPYELSGGEQQRVAIARALINNPKIIVADEPTGNLDPINSQIIMELLNKINQSGTTVIMTTHDVEIVNNYDHRVLLVKNNTIVSDEKGGYIHA